MRTPYCYNRPDFSPVGVWREGCAAWFKPAGNRWVMEKNPAGGEPWEACDGCVQKAKAEAMYDNA